MRFIRQNKNDWLLLNEPFFSEHSPNEILFHFAHNGKRCWQNLFYRGLKFHFG